jgi:hypothetical protein
MFSSGNFGIYADHRRQQPVRRAMNRLLAVSI